jgi:hypothetical protein
MLNPNFYARVTFILFLYLPISFEIVSHIKTDNPTKANLFSSIYIFNYHMLTALTETKILQDFMSIQPLLVLFAIYFIETLF